MILLMDGWDIFILLCLKSEFTCISVYYSYICSGLLVWPLIVTILYMIKKASYFETHKKLNRGNYLRSSVSVIPNIKRGA